MTVLKRNLRKFSQRLSLQGIYMYNSFIGFPFSLAPLISGLLTDAEYCDFTGKMAHLKNMLNLNSAYLCMKSPNIYVLSTSSHALYTCSVSFSKQTINNLYCNPNESNPIFYCCEYKYLDSPDNSVNMKHVFLTKLYSISSTGHNCHGAECSRYIVFIGCLDSQSLN